MSLRAWAWVSGIVALLSLAIPAGYSWFVYTRAPGGEMWSWGHEFVATFFSVGFAGAIGVWLYTWQTRRAEIARTRELRAAVVVEVFNTWDMVDDRHLQSIELPDGSEEKALLTSLQPTVFDEALRSSLFDASETMTLSRLSTVINLYNSAVMRLLPIYKSLQYTENEQVGSKRVEELRDAIYDVQDNRAKIVEAGERLLKLWSVKEIQRATNDAKPGSRQSADPRVAQIIEDHLPEISPAGYKAGLAAKMQQVQEAAKAGDAGTAHALIDDFIEEARALSGDKIKVEDAESLIAGVEEVRKELGSA